MSVFDMLNFDKANADILHFKCLGALEAIAEMDADMKLTKDEKIRMLQWVRERASAYHDHIVKCCYEALDASQEPGGD